LAINFLTFLVIHRYPKTVKT